MPISEKTKGFKLPIELNDFFQEYCDQNLTNRSKVFRRFIEECQKIENTGAKNKYLKLPARISSMNKTKTIICSFRISEDLKTWFNKYCLKRRLSSAEVFTVFVGICKYFNETENKPKLSEIIKAVANDLHRQIPPETNLWERRD